MLLNPSTADAERDDPTIRRCIGFARAWGYGAVDVVNLFAFRATQPRDLKRAPEALTPHHSTANWRAVLAVATRADLIVAAWGFHGAWRDAGAAMLARLDALGRRQNRGSGWLVSLGATKHGQPRHVLYLPRAAKRRPVRLALSDASQA